MKILEIVRARVSVLVLAALVLGVVGYEWQKLRSTNVIATASAKPKPMNSVEILAEGRLTTYPGAEVTLGAELGGRLLKLHVEERDVVKEGDVIAELDVKEQRAALQEARARVREAEADTSYLRRERSRSQQLFERNVVAESSLDKTVHESVSAERRRASLLATVSRLEKVVEKAKIYAPIDGTIVERAADAGEIVPPGAPLVTIANLDKLRIEAEVGEFDAVHVRLGAPVVIRAEGFGSKTWKGSVEDVPDRVVTRQLRPLDPARPVDTRVLLVKVRLEEEVPLRLGQRVEVEIKR